MLTMLPGFFCLFDLVTSKEIFLTSTDNAEYKIGCFIKLKISKWKYQLPITVYNLNCIDP